MEKKFNPNQKFTTGFTLIEVLIAIFVFGVMMVAITAFQKNVFSLNRFLSRQLSAEQDAQYLARTVIKEFRTMSPSSNGAYPIVTAATSTITFFTNIDADSAKERVRYFISGTELRRGIVQPTGNPAVYDTATETFSTLVHDIVNSGSSNLFTYYDTNYNGAGAALPSPIAVASVRLIKVTIVVDANPLDSPPPFTVTSQVSLRNLKDNL